jgi:hypothetical protein
MASVMATVANGGVVYRPKFVKRVESTDGTTVLEEQPEVVRDVGFKKSTLVQIRDALSDVVNSKRGTGSNAKLPGIEVGGKTGTAQASRAGGDKSSQKGWSREKARSRVVHRVRARRQPRDRHRRLGRALGSARRHGCCADRAQGAGALLQHSRRGRRRDEARRRLRTDDDQPGAVIRLSALNEPYPGDVDHHD